MGDDVKRRRPYDASGRRKQARETQRAVLRVARDLFVNKGYGQTTIAEIARGAGVSPELIYATFQSKPTLLHRVWDVTIGGDDEEVMFHEREEIVAIRTEPDLATRFRMHARMYAETARRITPLVRAVEAAAGADAGAARLSEEMGRQRLAGMSVMARDAAATGQLAVDELRCRDIVWAMTDGALWHRLVDQQGWSNDQFAEWLGELWVTVLVAASGRPPGDT